MGKPEEWKKSCFPVNKYQERIPPSLPFPVPFCSRLSLFLAAPCLAPRMLSTHSPTRHKKAQNVKRSSYGRKGIKYNKIIRSETGKRAEIEKMKEEKEV